MTIASLPGFAAGWRNISAGRRFACAWSGFWQAFLTAFAGVIVYFALWFPDAESLTATAQL